LQATPISPQLFQQSSQVSKSSGVGVHYSYWCIQNTSSFQLPVILRHRQPTVPIAQLSQQASVTVLNGSVSTQYGTDCDSFITIVSTCLSKVSTFHLSGKYCEVVMCNGHFRAQLQEVSQEDGLSVAKDTTEGTPQSSSPLDTSPDDELPPALTVPPPSFEGYVTEEANITVHANVNR